MKELIEEMMDAYNISNGYEVDDEYCYNDFICEVLDDGRWDHEDFKHLEQDGGGEGGSEYCYAVWSWRGLIYKIEYSYMSHEGHDYDGSMDTIREVKEVMVKSYE